MCASVKFQREIHAGKFSVEIHQSRTIFKAMTIIEINRGGDGDISGSYKQDTRECFQLKHEGSLDKAGGMREMEGKPRNQAMEGEKSL